MKKKPINGPWRVHTYGTAAVSREKDRLDAHGPRDFDELVISDWFHLERMSKTHWWLRVGGRSFDIVPSNHDGRMELKEQDV